jgi:hypothetical protein
LLRFASLYPGGNGNVEIFSSISENSRSVRWLYASGKQQ